jgi:hypothetical protein
MSFNQIVVSSTTILWYFSDKERGVHRPIGQSIFRCIRFHIGSITLGALLLNTVNSKKIINLY